MPISYIRESIEKFEITNSDRLTIVQKKVELKRGMKHEILACDIFQDAIIGYNDSSPAYITAFVTPYPVIYSNMNFATGMANRS